MSRAARSLTSETTHGIERHLEEDPDVTSTPTASSNHLGGPPKRGASTATVDSLAGELVRRGMAMDAAAGEALAREVLKKRGRVAARGLDEIKPRPPEPLLIGRLHPRRHTILFGAGGCGKGTLTSWWITQLAAAGRRVLLIDYEDHPDEWSSRISGLDHGALQRVVHVTPAGQGWTGTAIWEHTDALRDLILDNWLDVVVVDSIVPACGGADVTKPETASRYSQAVRSLLSPVLSLGHVTKEGDLRYPFGSMFWHNLARVTWSLSKRSAVQHEMELVCRKNNNGPQLPRTLVTVEWGGGLPLRVSERSRPAGLPDRCDEALMGGPLSLDDLLAVLRADLPTIKEDSVRKALARGVGRFEQRGRLWGRTSAGHDTP